MGMRNVSMPGAKLLIPAERALPEARRWGVARTHSRAEKVLHTWLLDRQIPSFLPLTRNRRAYGRHIRYSETPLFSGYVFFDLEACPRSEIFQSNKVAQILDSPNPNTLRCELEHLARALLSGEPLGLSKFKAGVPAQVVRGPLKGLEGEFVRIETTCFLILRITFLGHVAELKIDEAYVEPLHMDTNFKPQ